MYVVSDGGIFETQNFLYKQERVDNTYSMNASTRRSSTVTIRPDFN